jgi:hypothetical protein
LLIRDKIFIAILNKKPVGIYKKQEPDSPEHPGESNVFTTHAPQRHRDIPLFVIPAFVCFPTPKLSP